MVNVAANGSAGRNSACVGAANAAARLHLIEVAHSPERQRSQDQRRVGILARRISQRISDSAGAGIFYPKLDAGQRKNVNRNGKNLQLSRIADIQRYKLDKGCRRAVFRKIQEFRCVQSNLSVGNIAQNGGLVSGIRHFTGTGYIGKGNGRGIGDAVFANIQVDIRTVLLRLPAIFGIIVECRHHRQSRDALRL